MALYIYFDKDFNYVKSGEGVYVSQIELGMHCFVVNDESGTNRCQWFDFTDRDSPVEQHELADIWEKVLTGMDNMPPKVKTFFLLGGLEIAKQDLPS